MSRYIDADAAIKRFEELHGNENTLLNSYNADWIVSFIEGQATADVQEVKHGKWKVWGMFDDLVKCSCCGYQDTRNHVIYENLMYCGRCGAKMDGEHEQTT